MIRRTCAATALLLAAAGCSTLGDDAADPGGETTDISKEVVLVTHDSFALPDRLVRDFEDSSGYDLTIRPSGDAGALTSKLVLSEGSPLGDVAFGVDNTFAGRAIANDVFVPHGLDLGDDVSRYAVEGDDTLVPIDTASVCVNVDTAWYAERGQRPPRSFADLTKPAYADQLVTPGATTSSPGFAFLLAVIASHGGADSDDWQQYWSDLLANGAKVTEGWEDAYYVDFTAGGGKNATRPIVVSYDTSPAFTIDKKTGRSTTRALLDTCFRQVEYAGVLADTPIADGAEAVIEWLLSPEVQAALPTNMYVFPVVDGTPLPRDWSRFATQPSDPWSVAPADIDEHRDEWLTTWTDLTSR